MTTATIDPVSLTTRSSPVLIATLMRATFIAVVVLCSLPCSWSQSSTAPQWPQFRGPGGNAVASDGEPPTHFGPATNRFWKTTVPPGHSSPCIWGSKIFLTGSEGGKLQTLCLDRASGRILWRQTAPVDKIEPAHQISGPASSTPCTDGTVVISYFGSFGLLAYDFDGVEKWRQPLPPPM